MIFGLSLFTTRRSHRNVPMAALRSAAMKAAENMAPCDQTDAHSLPAPSGEER